jgi:uncharacterized protein with PIN domain
MKFVADVMLGKLTKWLRILGHDAHYERVYEEGRLDQLVGQGRCFLSRDRKLLDRYKEGILICGNHVGDQICGLNMRVDVAQDPSKWFTRCSVCNVLLDKASSGEAMNHVPEYAFYQFRTQIRWCPSCKRYYWPASHRKRMIQQLEKWGFVR